MYDNAILVERNTKMFEYDTERENLEHSREVLVEEYAAINQRPDWSQHLTEAAEILAAIQEIDRQLSALDESEEEYARDTILAQQELEDFEGLSYRDDEVAGDYGDW